MTHRLHAVAAHAKQLSQLCLLQLLQTIQHQQKLPNMLLAVTCVQNLWLIQRADLLVQTVVQTQTNM